MKNVRADITGAESSIDDSPTRDRVASTILHRGPSTAAELAEHLGLTPAAVRRHLDLLHADGIVAVSERRPLGPRGRGRPAKAYTLTSKGRDSFEHAYDALAADLLQYLDDTGGPEAVKDFARHRLEGFKNRYADKLSDVALEDRIDVLAAALNADGFAASTSAGPAGAQLCQHHCPVAHVAEQFPQLCEAETEVFAEILGTHVQRLATIAHGDGVCTTHLPAAHQTTSSDNPRRTTS